MLRRKTSHLECIGTSGCHGPHYVIDLLLQNRPDIDLGQSLILLVHPGTHMSISTITGATLFGEAVGKGY